MDIEITVQNVSNDHVHFKRLLSESDAVQVPYSSIISTLLYLYKGLDVKVNINVSL